MFGNARKRELEASIDRLTDERRKLKDELAELEQKRKMEDEDIRHLVRLKESQLDIEFRKKEVDLERKQQEEIAKIKDQYRDKMEQELGKQIERSQQMYSQILKLVPNIKVAMEGKV